ncbi:elongation factor P 5-aminopentanone reductase [Salinithrix halophila]|uniref:Elongation factor P 5-aminopentanone reductase n=1 Tax=Salinithrix halophila TaxID=1485204 RepID=A0ABV8JIV7_9BACL
MEKSLQAETALISGGSRGIGAAIARKLAAAGASVAVNYQHCSEKAQAVKEACSALGVQSRIYQADIRSREEVSKMAERVFRELGEPSILIHSAGVAGESLLFQDVTDDEYDRLMDTHVRGAYLLVQAVLPAMIRRRFGRIVLVSSIWGESGGAGEVVYSAAKGALNGMTRALAKELAPSGITVNAVAPGAILTDMLTDQLSEKERSKLAEQIPSGRLGETDEVASLTAYLCQREASYLTGQVLHINGGWFP